jgi:hypothetical protein
MENFRASSPRAPGIPGSSDWHAQPKIRGQALGIVYRTIATHLTRKADYTKTTAQTGSVNLACFYGVFAPNSKHRALVTRLQNGSRVANPVFTAVWHRTSTLSLYAKILQDWY